MPHASHPAPAATAPAHATLCRALAALEEAEAAGHPALLADACQRVAQGYRAVGEGPAALVMLEQALHWAGVHGAVDQALDLQCERVELLADLADLADTADRGEPGSGRALRERARDQVFETTRRATACADPRWEVTLLLRLSDVLDRFGDRDDATQLQVRALQLTVSAFYAVPAPRAEDAARLRAH